MANPEKSIQKGPEKTPSPKEQKPSGLSGEGFRLWVRENEAWQVSKMPESERGGLDQRLFGSKGYNPTEAKKIYEDIKNYPSRSKEKYGINSDTERSQILKILGRSLEK